MTFGVQLPLNEIIGIMKMAGVFQIMGNEKRKRVVVDYVPARAPMAIPRTLDESILEPLAPSVIPLIFTLEDTMVGGVVYAAITIGDRVVIEPFRWRGFEDLAKAGLAAELPVRSV